MFAGRLRSKIQEKTFFFLLILFFFLSGYRDARNMARDVHDIITDICSEYGKMSPSEAQSFVKKLETQRRYSADVWS